MSECKCGIGKPHGENGIPYDVPLPITLPESVSGAVDLTQDTGGVGFLIIPDHLFTEEEK